jgi:hypothetical protein
MQASGVPPHPEADSARRARAEAIAAMHLATIRRQFAIIRRLGGDDPGPRAREGFWCVVETVLAHLCGRRMTQKLLAAEVRGLISGPTLSRALADMEARDLIRCMPAPEDARVKLLLPTERALSILFTRADESYAEFAGIIAAAERRIAESPDAAGDSAVADPPERGASPPS